MKYRQTELLALTAKKTSDGVETIDIDLADPISEIYLDLRVTMVRRPVQQPTLWPLSPR